MSARTVGSWSQPVHAPDRARHGHGATYGLELATAALVVSATLAFTEVFVGTEALLPLLGAAVAALAIGALGRALRLPAWAAALLSLAGLAWFLALVFAPRTLAAGLLPTRASLDAVLTLWRDGLELVQLRPTPALPEPELVLLAVLGVWVCAYTVDGLVLRLHSPLAGVVMALVLWAVPLTLAGSRLVAPMLVVPLLLSIAGVLLAVAAGERDRFGRWSAPSEGRAPARRRSGAVVAGVGVVMSLVVLVAALPAAQALPGHAQEPWVDVTELGDPTLADNPIVDMQQRLVSADETTVLRVRSTRPVYLKTTSLDRYDDQERWTNGGIEGASFSEVVPLSRPPAVSEPAGVEVEVVGDLGSRAVLLPAPFPTLYLTGDAGQRARYDRDLATFTLPEGRPLGVGDAYQATAVLPAPDGDVLRAAGTPDNPRLWALPEDVPEQVGVLAREIVERAGADTPYDQALAIQAELRSWTYSLDIPGGHSGTAMERFLEARAGYCEQFAGTMAVMLRSLGIPARVAVGFTPGQRVEGGEDGQPSTYEVSWSNLHAWPEVLFDDQGWIAFEPTPRSDGNVLVPVPGDVAPDELERSTTAGADFSLDPDLAAAARAEAEALANLQNREGLGDSVDSTGTRSPVATRVGAVTLAVVLVAGLAVLAVLVLVARRRRDELAMPERERVLAAVQRLQTLAAARGRPPGPHETDAEYLDRLLEGIESGRRARLLVPPPGAGVSHLRDAAAALRAGVEQVRWAPTVSARSAAAAEAGAEELVAALLRGLRTRRRRVTVRLRWAWLQLRAPRLREVEREQVLVG